MDASQPASPDEQQGGGNVAAEGVSLDGDVSNGAAQSGDSVTDASKNTDSPPNKPKGGIKNILKKFNIYLLLFVFCLVVAGVIVAVGYFQSQKASNQASLKTQNLTQNTLNQVAQSDATVGSSSEVLNVESSAVFAGQVLIRNDLQVAGSLEIGGTVALTNLTVGGTTALAQLSVSKDLALSGNASIQGSETIAQSLQVNGSGTFSGNLSAPQVTTNNLNLNSTLNLTHHIAAGGATPGHTQGSALGGGGTATVGGSDTSGSITINTGSNPSAGCFITVQFSQPFNQTPHVVVTPIGAAAGQLQWYVTRTSTEFSVCADNSAPSGSSFGFDYFVVD